MQPDINQLTNNQPADQGLLNPTDLLVQPRKNLLLPVSLLLVSFTISSLLQIIFISSEIFPSFQTIIRTIGLIVFNIIIYSCIFLFLIKRNYPMRKAMKSFVVASLIIIAVASVGMLAYFALQPQPSNAGTEYFSFPWYISVPFILYSWVVPSLTSIGIAGLLVLPLLVYLLISRFKVALVVIFSLFVIVGVSMLGYSLLINTGRLENKVSISSIFMSFSGNNEPEIVNNKIYYVDSISGKLYETNIDGTNNKVISTDKSFDSFRYFLFSYKDKLYYEDYGSMYSINLKTYKIIQEGDELTKMVSDYKVKGKYLYYSVSNGSNPTTFGQINLDTGKNLKIFDAPYPVYYGKIYNDKAYYIKEQYVHGDNQKHLLMRNDEILFNNDQELKNIFFDKTGDLFFTMDSKIYDFNESSKESTAIFDTGLASLDIVDNLSDNNRLFFFSDKLFYEYNPITNSINKIVLAKEASSFLESYSNSTPTYQLYIDNNKLIFSNGSSIVIYDEQKQSTKVISDLHAYHYDQTRHEIYYVIREEIINGNSGRVYTIKL